MRNIFIIKIIIMDMYWAAVLSSKINMKESYKKENKINLNIEKDNQNKINMNNDKNKKDNNCTKCGQNPYFCQCLNINKLIKEIDFEKDNY